MNKIWYIDTPDQLHELCELIKSTPWLALDTEFLREKTYYPKFCLLQIATPDWVACVDPLALTDLKEFFEVINKPEIIKVFHSCHQDLEILYQLTGTIPGPIFDTQVAAPLLGFQDNPGYAMLVSSLLNINLNKAHTRADWSKRPLTEAEIQYAADDVIYLCQIYQAIVQKLAALDRSDWLQDDFKELENPENYRVRPDQAWLKIRGKNKLNPRQLTVIQALAEWRERTAQNEDRPKNWLIRDEVLLDMARLQPDTLTALKTIRGLNERIINRFGKTLCGIIEDAKKREPIQYKEKIRSYKKTQQHEAILDILTALVRIRAEGNSLNPAILANRKDLEELLLGDIENSPLMHGWRYTMAGKDLVGLIEGQLFLGIESEKLVIFDKTKSNA